MSCKRGADGVRLLISLPLLAAAVGIRTLLIRIAALVRVVLALLPVLVAGAALTPLLSAAAARFAGLRLLALVTLAVVALLSALLALTALALLAGCHSVSSWERGRRIEATASPGASSVRSGIQASLNFHLEQLGSWRVINAFVVGFHFN
jgi:hypothetical protein